MVLLDVASKVLSTDQISVFHLDHGLRNESKENEIFVQNICSTLEIKYYTKKLSAVPKANTESNWRKSRQTLSAQAAQDFGATRILTAHHATDLVETIIFRLTKGAGPAGLSPFDTSTKPFWEVPKEALLKYAQDHNLEWREDVTNQETKHERNLIRHEVLPHLRKITPNLEKVFVKEAEIFGEVQDFIKTELQHRCQTELKARSIPLSKFLNLPPILQKEFLRKIAGTTPSQSEINDTLRWLINEPQGQSQKPMGAVVLRIERQQIHWDHSVPSS